MNSLATSQSHLHPFNVWERNFHLSYGMFLLLEWLVTFEVVSESVCPEVLQEVVAVGSSAAYHEPRHGAQRREEQNTAGKYSFLFCIRVESFILLG